LGTAQCFIDGLYAHGLIAISGIFCPLQVAQPAVLNHRTCFMCTITEISQLAPLPTAAFNQQALMPQCSSKQWKAWYFITEKNGKSRDVKPLRMRCPTFLGRGAK